MDFVLGSTTLVAAEVKHLILGHRRQANDPAAGDIRLSYQAEDDLQHLKPSEDIPLEAGTTKSPLVIDLLGILTPS
jgi:hypothetical protein